MLYCPAESTQLRRRRMAGLGRVIGWVIYITKYNDKTCV